MPRALSPSAIRASQRENNPDPFLLLLSVNVGAEWVRLVSNTENIYSRGVLFLGCPFSFVLPDSLEQALSEATIQIDNVDTRVWQGLRLIETAAYVIIEIILASEPDTILLSSDGLRLREATATTATISAKIVPDTIWQQGFPAHDYDPAQNEGLFRA
jgi:hypothetical protein